VTLSDGRTIGYEMLVTAPGLQLDFDKIEGLTETLGQNGVTSNYRYMEARSRAEIGNGHFHATAYAHQMRGSAPEGDVSFRRSLAQSRCAG